MQKRAQEGKDKTLEELVIDIKSVVKVTKGGRQRRFSAIVVVGDRKGRVGLGIGKANEVPDAIKKAIQDANKNLVRIPLIDGRTVAHEAIGTAGAARVIIKPAAAGTGVIAGGSVRAVLELAGVRDIVSKSLGARTKLNMARAALNALKSIKTPEEVAAEVDRQIHSNYALWPNNYFSYDYLKGSSENSDKYSGFDSNAFLASISHLSPEVRSFVLNSYANPVRSFLGE